MAKTISIDLERSTARIENDIETLAGPDFTDGEFHDTGLPPLDATVTLNPQGGWQKLVLRDPKATAEITPLKGEDGKYVVMFNARNWQPPVGPGLEFSDLSFRALVSKSDARVSDVQGGILGGALTGSANLRWGKGLAADGEFTLKRADAATMLAAFTRLVRERPEQRDNVVQGIVTGVAYLGDSTRFLLQLPNGTRLQVTRPNTDRRDERLSYDDDVWAYWEPGSPVVVSR